MKNSYNNSEISYIMQGLRNSDGTYTYTLVDKNLVDDSYIKNMTPAEATCYAKLNKIERVSSGYMAIMRSDKNKSNKYWESL